MRLATAEQSQQIDRQSQEHFKLSPETLMEAAGTLAAREIEQLYFSELARGCVLIVCGPGHNGGDGMVVARHLHARGRRVQVVVSDEPKTEVLRLQRERLHCMGIPVRSTLLDWTGITLVVDALFGIGLAKPMTDPWLSWVREILASKKTVVSLDTPSGLNVDTGQIADAAVIADTTLTFGLAKPGFFIADGPRVTGRLRILNIGFPKTVVEECAKTISLVMEQQVARALPERSDHSHKGSHGHAAILAGRPGFWGAGVLAAHAAFRVGAGYVTWASHTSPAEEIQQVPECLTVALDGEFFKREWQAIAVGPGLGVTDATAEVIRKLKTLKTPVAIDADALTVAHQFGLLPLPQHWVATPHAGELARILGEDPEKLNSDRLRAVRTAHAKLGCHVLFKGFRTVLFDGVHTAILPVGNSALAKAGTGDVLTGLLAGLLAQGLSPFGAATTAGYLHGRIADEFQAMGGDKVALMASDIYELLPQILSQLRGYARDLDRLQV